MPYEYNEEEYLKELELEEYLMNQAEEKEKEENNFSYEDREQTQREEE